MSKTIRISAIFLVAAIVVNRGLQHAVDERARDERHAKALNRIVSEGKRQAAGVNAIEFVGSEGSSLEAEIAIGMNVNASAEGKRVGIPMEMGISDTDESLMLPMDMGMPDTDESSMLLMDMGMPDTNESSMLLMDMGISDTDESSMQLMDMEMSDSGESLLMPMGMAD